VLLLSMFMWYMFSHMQAYLVSQRGLTVPEWFPKLRNFWVVTNLVLGNIVIISVTIAQRAFVAFLAQQIVGFQIVLLSFVLLYIVRNLTKELEGVLERYERTLLCELVQCRLVRDGPETMQCSISPRLWEG